jgi:hypothetical protein
VASLAVQRYWRREIAPEFPQLSLTEEEAVVLSPYVPPAESKKEAAKSLTALDFVVKNGRLKKRQLLFHIELKSGPRSIEEMGTFQLDINDSNDMIGVMNNTRLPAYIFHVQTEFCFDPPTRASKAKGIWWTDFFTLRKNRTSIKRRKGEYKEAGYYRPSAFKPIDSFSAELRSKRYRELERHLLAHRLRMH